MNVNGSLMARYPKTAEAGLRYQDFVKRLLLVERGMVIQFYDSAYGQLNYGESLSGTEAKLDTRCTETGRLSIEIAEKSRPEMPYFVASGIYAPTRPIFYVQGNYTVSWLFATKDLIRYHQVNVRIQGKGAAMWYEDETIRRFFLPLQDANRECITKIIVRPDGQYNLLDNKR